MPENVEIGIDVFRDTIYVEIKINHILEFVERVEPTCTTAGNIAHYICTHCGLYYEDEKGEIRLYDVHIDTTHNFVDGICTRCGKVLDEINIVYIEPVSHLGKFALGTLENAIGLPSKINVRTADWVTHQLDVIWNLETYNKSQVGTYTITGHLQSGNFRYSSGLSSTVTAQVQIVDYMEGTADIVFVLDTTGSMGDEINNVKSNIIAFAEALEAKGVSARWAAVNYLDWIDSNEPSYIVKNGASDWYTTAKEYETAVGNISLGYGGDGPETAIDGLMLATTLTSRKDARVFYILVTDAEYKVANNYGMTSLQQTANYLDENGINVSVIAPTNYQSYYAALTNTTGGIMSNIYGNFSTDLLNSLVPLIQEKVEA